MRTRKGNQEEEEDYRGEDDLGSKREDGKENDKASAVRSKHSVTEQRKRSKINERFQVLRELIPNSEQKRDTASFLLERNNHWRVQSLANHPVAVNNGTGPVIPFPGKFEEITVASPPPIHPLVHREQANNECHATSDGLGLSGDLIIEGGTISISTVYSHELLNSLTQALQNAGIDLSHAKLSVHIDLGKWANQGLMNKV
ncbi:hypothetical protein N665_0079s0094 [Sinapis alba]|nr:hypothetical protein N665_0079s0094 [Sinapis alba]